MCLKPVRHQVIGLCGHAVIVIEYLPADSCQILPNGPPCNSKLDIRVEDKSTEAPAPSSKDRGPLCNPCEVEQATRPYYAEDGVYQYEGTVEENVPFPRKCYRHPRLPEGFANLQANLPEIKKPEDVPPEHCGSMPEVAASSKYFPGPNYKPKY